MADRWDIVPARRARVVTASRPRALVGRNRRPGLGFGPRGIVWLGWCRWGRASSLLGVAVNCNLGVWYRFSGVASTARDSLACAGYGGSLWPVAGDGAGTSSRRRRPKRRIWGVLR